MLELRKEERDAAKGKGSTKGKGKGKGVGKNDKGKGKGKSSGPRPGDWYCKSCENVDFNFATRAVCRWCEAKWDAVAEPKPRRRSRSRSTRSARTRSRTVSRGRPVRRASRKRSASRVKIIEDDTEWEEVMTKKEKKALKRKMKSQERWKLKEEERKAKEEAVGEEIMEVDKEEERYVEAVKDLTAAERKRMGLAPCTKPDFKALFRWPAATPKAPKDATETVAEAAAVKASAAIAEMDKNITKLKDFLGANTGEGDAFTAPIQNLIDAKTKEREALTKKGAEGAVSVEKLKLNLAKGNDDEAERVRKAKEDQKAHLEKAAKLRDVLAEKLAMAQKQLADFDSILTEHATKVTAEEHVKTEHHAAVKAEWERRIAESPAEAGSQIPEDKSNVPEAAATQISGDYYLEAQFIPDEVPVIMKVSKEQREFLEDLWSRLITWKLHGRMEIRYGELLGNDMKGIKSIIDILGNSFWERLYGSRTEGIELDDIVPSQLRWSLSTALEKVGKDLSDGAKHLEKMKEAVAAFKEYKLLSVMQRTMGSPYALPY